MTTISAVQAAAAVTLVLTTTTNVDSILRSDANGNALVRVPAGTFPRATTVTLTDWEAAISGPVTYTAGDAVARLTMTASSPWLIFPFRTGLALELIQVNDYSAGRTSLGTAHQVPGRPEPLVALGRLAYRSGSLDILCESLAAVRTLESNLDKAGLAMLKSPDQPGMDMYFTAADITTKQVEGGLWMASMAYLETARPSADLSAWTFKALRQSFATFAAVREAFEDFDALARNDRTVP